MKILLFLITFYARFRSAFPQYCINDGVTDFQLTSSGYYVDSSISCVSVCNSYSPGVFFYAFFLEKQLCFCKNSFQLNISPSSCSTTQCLIGSSNCILSNYEYFPLSLGIIDWEITFNPTPALVDNEVQIQTNILKGDASSAYVIPTTNGLTTNGLPSDVQSVNGTTVKTHFYLPGLQLWSQKIGNKYANPINTSIWLQIDEKVGGVYVNPLIVNVNGFYNFFLTITQGTKVSVNISLPMNKNVNFTADVICLSYGLDLSMFYNTSDGNCSLKDGFVLNQVILSSGYLKKIKLKVSNTGTLKIHILRPSISSTIFCALGSGCTNTLSTSNPVTALVVKRFLFSLPVKGIIEIPLQNIAVDENDIIWIGGSASLYCNGNNYVPMDEMNLGSIVTFSIDETNNNGFFISFFVSKPIEYYVPVSSNTPGLFNFVIDVSNNVSSSQRLNYSYPIQIPISGLRFANNKPFSKDVAGYKINGWLTLQAVIDNGTDVMYLFDIPKLYFSSNVSSGSVDFKLTTLGVFTVYLTAGNKINSVNTSIEIAVLSEINSIKLYAENNQLQNSSYNTSVTILNGTDVHLILDFGDGTPVLSLTNINATGINGFTYTILHMCISNCETKLNFQERVIYSFVCEDCGSRRLVAKWIIKSDASTEPLTDNDTRTGFSTPSLVIKRDILLETKNYTFNLIVGYADSINSAKFEFTKTACSKPAGGVCFVNPTSGYALDTKFSIVCYGWRDADGLLFYRFYYDNGQIERMNLSSTNSVDYPLLNAETIDQPSLVNFVMGPGDQKNDYKIIIFLRVSNKYNAYTEQNITIKVKPNKKLLNITDLLTDVNLNDTQSVSNLVQAISSTSNRNSSSLNNISSTSNSELRTQVIGLINNIPIIDLSSFKSVSDGLVLSIKYPSEISSQAQSQAANIVERLSGYLTKQNLKGFGADSFDTLTQSLLNSLSSLFLTSFNYTDPGLSFIPDNKTTSSATETTATTTTSAALSNLTVNVNMVSKLFDSMNKYFLAAHSYKVPGEIATMGETKQFNFELKKNFSFDVSNSSIGSFDGGFLFPNVDDIFNNSMQTKQILINNVRMKSLVYTWDTNRSENILTESQSLSIFGLDGLPIKVTNTSKPINIAIKNIPEKMNGKNISLSMPNDVFLVKLPLKSDCKMLLKFLFKNDPNNLTNLIVYIQYGKVASKFDYDIMLNISAKDGIFMTKNNNPVQNLTFANTFTDKMNGFLRNQDAKLNDDGTLVLWNFNSSTYAPSNNSELHLSFCYSGPMPDKKLNENEYTFDQAEYSGKFEYEMKSYCAECNYWNENTNKWMSDGCELDVHSTNFLVTKCKCTHLTTFGGFFIAPNPLLPLSLALFKQGYILTVAVAVVILLWLLCLPFARRMDKQDDSKIGVCPLYDNREGETYLYQIIVHTGGIRNAGTKSNIFLTVAGDISESGVRHLKDPVRKCFQRSSCDVFIMSTCSSLGDLDFVRLWHDNSGGGWYLRNIIIIDLQTEKEFLFIGHRWMAVDRGNCLVDCVIPVASVEESTNFNYVFKTMAQHKLLDEHLWLSVLTRLPQSNFTRCQRLSVAFSLIMTSMMVSVMFYRGYKNEPGIENGLFNFSFDKEKVLLILICSCIKFPVELIFVKLFCSIRPFQNLEMNSDDLSRIKDNKIEEDLKLSYSQLLKKNSLTSTDAVTCITCEENRKSTSMKTVSKKYFPVWCLYMTWFICIGNIFGCGFIVLRYGMSFGNNQSLHWLTIIIVDLAKEIFLFGPVKIFITAIFITLVVKKVKEDKGEIKLKGKALALNQSWLHKPKDKSLILNKDDGNIQPPDPASLKKMRDLRLKHLKMYSLMTELILYIFYAILAFRIGYFARESFAFYQTRNIQELFNLKLRGVPWPRDYSKIYGKIQSSKKFWPWMEELFFPQVYPDPWYNLSAFYSNTSKQNFPGKLFLNDLTSKIVNGIRIRQVRIQPDSCRKAYLMSNFIKIDCLSSYTSSLEETRDFDLNWKIPKQYNSPIIPSTMPWRYQTWQELDGYPYAAGLDIYYGGGYVLEIFPKWKNKAILEQLKNSKWIDRQTRAVIIEFALFNAATNYFTMVTMALEFPASGGVVPTSSILTFQLFSSGTNIYVWHFLFILMVLVLTIRHFRLLYRSGCKYFLEFWSLVESSMILFSIIAVGFFFFKGYLVKMLLQRLLDKKPQAFINFQFASYWDLVYVNLISLVIFFVTLKFIKLLQFNRRVSLVSYTLKVAWYPLTMFGIVFFIILCSFVFSSAIIFGAFMDDYKTFFNTITSIVSLLLGRFSFIQYKNANGFLGPIFFYGFNIIVIWIIMNMFVSILNDAFRNVRTRPDNQTNDYEIIEFLLEQLKDLLGYRWIKEENAFSYQNEKISDIKHESDTYKRVSYSNGILSKTSDFNEDSVENEVFYTLESENSIYAKFPQKKYLFNSNEHEIGANESLNKFIICVNLLYLKKSMHEFVTMK
ncbi:uncharacterized protein LOC105844737 isoform X6 [Hydra vulgaris]|uniref:Uncharacterized protein LOC105844737 isoform X6 n=1 Tax=Hydra vulgaris TaxID=6087 RepID=A0ABM4CF01_HYDVU